MADLETEYSDLVKDAPLEATGPFHHQTFKGELTKLDNVGGGVVEVVRDNPMLPRREP